MTDLELAEEIKWRAQKLREYAASTEYPSDPFCIDTAYYMEKILAALRREPERPLSGEMVMVSREQLLKFKAQFERHVQASDHVNDMVEEINVMLSTAEASKEAK